MCVRACGKINVFNCTLGWTSSFSPEDVRGGCWGEWCVVCLGLWVFASLMWIWLSHRPTNVNCWLLRVSRHPWPRASSSQILSSAHWLMLPVCVHTCASNLLHYNDADLIKVFYSPVVMRKRNWVDGGPVRPLVQAALGESTELIWLEGTYELLELLDIVFPSLTGDVNDMTSSWGNSRRHSLSPPNRPQFCT